MKDDLEDIPMAYLWYVVLAIMAIMVTAVIVVIYCGHLLWSFDCFRGLKDCGSDD